jgi:hypothetical protein
MKTRHVLSAVLVLLSCHPAVAEGLLEPSFGLRWGMSPQEFGSAFDEIDRETEGDLLLITSSGTPDALPSNTDFLQAIFWEDRLIKFTWASDNFTGDLDGSEGKKAYSALAETLTRKHGRGEEITVSGRELYEEPDEFYECMKYDGCGAWLTYWSSPANEDNVALLQLRGLGRGEGFLRYVVEHPDWYRHGENLEVEDATKF